LGIGPEFGCGRGVPREGGGAVPTEGGVPVLGGGAVPVEGGVPVLGGGAVPVEGVPVLRVGVPLLLPGAVVVPFAGGWVFGVAGVVPLRTWARAGISHPNPITVIAIESPSKKDSFILAFPAARFQVRSLALPRCSLSDAPAAQNQRCDEHNQKQEEKNFRNPCGSSGNAGESQQGRNDGNDQKCYRPA
jgi:hypothetical protein